MSIQAFCATHGPDMSRDDPRMEGCGAVKIPLPEVEQGPCCMALNTKCSACAAGMSIQAFCATHGPDMSRDDPRMEGCGAVKIPLPKVIQGECCMALNTKCSACAAGMSIQA